MLSTSWCKTFLLLCEIIRGLLVYIFATALKTEIGIDKKLRPPAFSFDLICSNIRL